MNTRINSKFKLSKNNRRYNLIINLTGVLMILFGVLGCSRIQNWKSGGEISDVGDNSAADNNRKSNKKSSDRKLSLKEAIIGEWEGKIEGNPVTMTFTADGRTTMIVGGRSRPARYKVLDEQTIALADGGDENYNERSKVKISGDTLTLSQPSGTVIGEFTRTGDVAATRESDDESGDSADSKDAYQLKQELALLSMQFRAANQRDDKAKMEEIMADDFTITINDKTYNKQESIETSSANKKFISAFAKDTRITANSGSRAVLAYTMVLEFKDKTITEKCQDEFVKSDDWHLKTILSCSSSNVTEK